MRNIDLFWAQVGEIEGDRGVSALFARCKSKMRLALGLGEDPLLSRLNEFLHRFSQGKTDHYLASLKTLQLVEQMPSGETTAFDSASATDNWRTNCIPEKNQPSFN